MRKQPDPYRAHLAETYGVTVTPPGALGWIADARCDSCAALLGKFPGDWEKHGVWHAKLEGK